ncbi:MAG: metallophosphoesterase family protein [Planctomycetes bacterium]|nr:metallophosphoesterase family protein [Planctomycetota bacterium]
MKQAIISDIHGNLAAFEAVLDDISKEKVDEIYCLGDIIGYGPDPRACLELAHRFPINLLGNHEEAVLMGAIGFNPKAKAAIDWTRDQLNLDSQPVEKNRQLWNFLGSLKRRHLDGEKLFVHGSPRDPTREYIFHQDWQDRKKMDEIFASPEGVRWKICFTGHTHFPGIFTQENTYRFYEPKAFNLQFNHENLPYRVIVNVGSVGQPRDGDYRASYVVLNGRNVQFKRIDYDVQRTIARFRACPELPEYLARRLEEGK